MPDYLKIQVSLTKSTVDAADEIIDGALIRSMSHLVEISLIKYLEIEAAKK